MAWDADHEIFLRENYGKISASLIAKRVGKSREAVTAKADRLGLSSKLGANWNLDRSHILAEKRKYDVPFEFPPTFDSVEMIDLTDDDCRWPCGEKFCGHSSRAGSSYCDKHHRLAFVVRVDN